MCVILPGGFARAYGCVTATRIARSRWWRWSGPAVYTLCVAQRKKQPIWRDHGSNPDMISRRSVGGTALLVLLLSCGGERRSEKTFDIQLPQPEILVSTESALLGNPSDIALDSEGRLWIADPVNKRVVLLAYDGRMIRTIGRGGRGPGEFQYPTSVAANDTSSEFGIRAA